jgi:uncharacterized protein (UPF0333 family)
MKRGLLYFILFDIAVVIFIIISFSSNKNTSEQVAPSVISTQNASSNPVRVVENRQIQAQRVEQVINQQPTQQPVQTLSQNTYGHLTSSCSIYGPLNIEQKMQFDLMLHNILPRQDYSQSITQSKSSLIEVYWNLGKDKIAAINTFEQQKNHGALKDEKFKLVHQNGDWIVPIALIANDKNIAQQMINQLSQSSSYLGGQWQYQYKEDGYFYQFNNTASLQEGTINKIDQIYASKKSACIK